MAAPRTHPRLAFIPRSEFLRYRWSYETGEHVTILAPTGWGKTHLAQELLAATATPERPAISMVMKPRDDTVSRWARGARFKTVRDWPPRHPWPWQEQRPRGYLLWPRPIDDVDEETERHREIFARCILDSYKRGGRIIFADEMFSLVNELKLAKDVNRVWTKGRSMGCGQWAASQRPSEIPLHAYSMASHLFIGYDKDKRARERYEEISGMDPGLVAHYVALLPEFHWLYIRSRDRKICIIGP